MNQRYEILDGLPTYGEMAIPIVDEDDIFVSEGYVVKFYKDDGSTWIANFPKGFNNFSCVKELKNSNNLLVVSGGEGYLMNPNYPEPIKDFYYSIEEIIKRDDNGFVLATLTDIIFLNEYAEQEWRQNISWDGIKDLQIKGNLLSGYCYDIFLNDENRNDFWIKFTLNMDTKEFKGGCSKLEDFKERKPWYRYIWVGGFILLLYYQLSR